jgi:small-conductance mechanosensitive channel
MNRRIKRRFDELGIEIPYPHQKLVISREEGRHRALARPGEEGAKP